MGNLQATVEGMSVKEQEKVKDKATNSDEGQLNKPDAALQSNVKEQEKVQDKASNSEEKLDAVSLITARYSNQLLENKLHCYQQSQFWMARGKRINYNLHWSLFIVTVQKRGKQHWCKKKIKVLMYVVIMKEKKQKNKECDVNDDNLKKGRKHR